MKSKKNVLIAVLLLIISCDSLTNDNMKIADEIVRTLEAEQGELFFKKYLFEDNKEKEYYIQFKLIKSQGIEKGLADSKLVASYCASQLFNEIDKETIDRNFGFEIIINSSIKNETFFFEKKDIKYAWEGINSINEYIKLIQENNFEKAIKILNIEDYPDKGKEISKKIHERIAGKKIETVHFFSDYTNVKENDCWLIVLAIKIEDKQLLTIKSLVEKLNTDKIIYIEFE